jgi:large subunit ribosomal protein L4e
LHIRTTAYPSIAVKQERLKKKNAKKPKQPTAAGEAFTATLFAP